MPRGGLAVAGTSTRLSGAIFEAAKRPMNVKVAPGDRLDRGRDLSAQPGDPERSCGGKLVEVQRLKCALEAHLGAQTTGWTSTTLSGRGA